MPRLANGWLIVSLLVTTSLRADDQIAEFEMVARVETALGVSNQQVQKAEIILLPTLDLTFDKVSFKVVGRYRFDSRDQTEPGRPQDLTTDRFSRRWLPNDDTEVELREFFADFQVGKSFVRLGKQQIVWGQSDGLKVLDLLNPQSFREFVLEGFDESRTPLWSAMVEIPIGSGTLDVVWIPEKTFHTFPDEGALFALGSLTEQPGIRIGQVERPSRSLDNSDAGLRYSIFLGGWDLSFNYLLHHFDVPFFQVSNDDQGVLLTPTYNRTHLFGGTAAKAFGSMVLRLEYALQTDRQFPALQSFESLESDEFSTVLGIDWTHRSGTLFSAQWFQATALGHNQDFAGVETQEFGSFLISKSFLSETLSIQATYLQDLSDRGKMIRSKLTYRSSDWASVSLFFDVFSGDEDNFFGQFDRQDRFGISFEFGIL